MIRYKNSDLKVEDVDDQHRKVVIYVSSFDNLDSDGDIITFGAFSKTINERGPKSNSPRIKHLREHFELIGKPLEMVEDVKGLRVVSVLSNSTLGKDTIEDYKLDLFEHSIGFEVIDRKPTNNAEIQYLTELKLWEYSSVIWGANMDTPLQELKGYTKEDILNRINSKMDRIGNAIRKGDYTDERFEALEIQLQGLKKNYNDYINSLSGPSVKDTSKKPDLQELGELFEGFKNRINGN